MPKKAKDDTQQPSNYADNYEILKDKYLSLNDALLDDILHNFDTPENEKELENIQLVSVSLMNDLDKFKEYSKTTEGQSLGITAEKINDTLEMATDSIKAINQAIIENIDSYEFRQAQYKNMVSFLMGHLQDWQDSLNGIHDIVPIPNFEPINIEHQLNHSIPVVSANANPVKKHRNYTELRDEYIQLKKDVFAEISKIYSSVVDDHEILDLYEKTNKSLEHIAGFHQKFSTHSGKLLGLKEEDFENILNTAIQQLKSVRNSFNSSVTDTKPIKLQYGDSKKLLSEHVKYFEKSASDMYDDTIKTSLNFQSRVNVSDNKTAALYIH